MRVSRPISRPLSHSLTHSLGGLGVALNPLQSLITSLFSASEQGAFYIPMPVVLGAQSLFQDAAGTVPVTADGDPVGRMLNQSGNGYHAIQTVSGSRPVYRTDGVLHWLEFDGVNDYLITSSLGYGNNSKMSWSVGIKRPGSSSTAIAFEFGPVNSNGGFNLISPRFSVADYSAQIKGTSSINLNTLQGEYALGSTNIISVSAEIPTESAALRVDGVLKATGGNMGTGNFNDNVLYLGSRQGDSLNSNIRIYGTVFVSKVVDDFSNLESYLADLAGVNL